MYSIYLKNKLSKMFKELSGQGNFCGPFFPYLYLLVFVQALSQLTKKNVTAQTIFYSSGLYEIIYYNHWPGIKSLHFSLHHLFQYLNNNNSRSRFSCVYAQ